LGFQYGHLIRPFDTAIWYGHLIRSFGISIRSFDTAIWYGHLIRSFKTVIWYGHLGFQYGHLIRSFNTAIWYGHLIRSFDKVIQNSHLIQAFDTQIIWDVQRVTVKCALNMIRRVIVWIHMTHDIYAYMTHPCLCKYNPLSVQAFWCLGTQQRACFSRELSPLKLEWLSRPAQILPPVLLDCSFLGLAKTIYTHRIRLYVWWFPCQKYHIYTPYIPVNVWFWPTLLISLLPLGVEARACSSCRPIAQDVRQLKCGNGCSPPAQ